MLSPKKFRPPQKSGYRGNRNSLLVGCETCGSLRILQYQQAYSLEMTNFPSQIQSMNYERLIAIGYSAGGMEPLLSFFDNTVPSGATYFILNHMPIDSPSQLKEILIRHSSLEIIMARSNLTIGKNRVYLTPSHMHMSVQFGKLRLEKRVRSQTGPNYAFSIFLNSLIEGENRHVVAIFLSGAGSDGARSLAGIKSLGGIVLAQDPATCEFPFMPTNAIETGHVDRILHASDMPAFIRRLSGQSHADGPNGG